MATAKSKRPKGLDPDQVAQIALEIADRDGLDALTMRGLAERLGIGTMTLYGYFPNKEKLLDAAVDAAVAGREPPTPSGDWNEQLRSVVLWAREGLLEHPSIVELRTRRPVLRPDALRFSELIVGILREAGFPAAEAAPAFRLLFTYTLGFAALSPATGTESDRAEAQRVLATLPAAHFPALSEMRDEASAAMGGEEVFRYGLDRIIDGLEAQLSRLAS
jgi:AcrR family transcriptional regulator